MPMRRIRKCFFVGGATYWRSLFSNRSAKFDAGVAGIHQAT